MIPVRLEALDVESEDPETEAIEERLILEAIYAKYGYDLRGYTSGLMGRRLRAALSKSGLSHFGELQHRLLENPSFFARVLHDLTIQVSEMFRDPPFYETFRARVVPVLRTYPQVKIWHAGCASGEEVYSTAILLEEENLYRRALLYATDLSPTALARAKEGIYTKDQWNAYSHNYHQAGGQSHLQNYCSTAYGRFAVRDSLRKNVVFFQHNLVSDHSLGEMNVIFCRNVLIYFGSRLGERVLRMLTSALCHGGFLCLGSSESLPPSFSGMFEEFAPRERIYRLVRKA